MSSNQKFLLSLGLHTLHGFLLEKSKLYYPYTLSRNVLLIRSDLFKFYLSIAFIFLGLPYVYSKISPNRYAIARTFVETRYQSRSPFALQIGSYLLGIAMALTGFCPSFLPIYLAISPVLFLYSIAASYTAYIFYHIFGRLFFNRMHIGPIQYESNQTGKIASACERERLIVLLLISAVIVPEKETLTNIARIIILSFCIILLLVFETGEQSVSWGHSPDELLDLIYHGDYIPPGLSGILCGFVNFLLIFVCGEYQSLTSEWLMNIFYYTSEFSLEKTHVNGQLCFEQVLKIIAMSFGVRLSLWTSKRQEVPIIDWLFYSLVGCGSFIGAFSICLTTATFSDHVYLINGFVGCLPGDILSMAMGAAWVLMYFSKLFGISNLK